MTCQRQHRVYQSVRVTLALTAVNILMCWHSCRIDPTVSVSIAATWLLTALKNFLASLFFHGLSSGTFVFRFVVSLLLTWIFCMLNVSCVYCFCLFVKAMIISSNTLQSVWEKTERELCLCAWVWCVKFSEGRGTVAELCLCIVHCNMRCCTIMLHTSTCSSNRSAGEIFSISLSLALVFQVPL